MVSHDKKRELPTAEIEKIRAYVAEQEKLAYPDYSISVTVKKQTNDEGNPIVNITRMRELEKPIKWPL